MLRDLKFALRMLVNRPGFTAVAILTLALGIGVNSAIFSVVNGVLFHSVPFAERDRLVFLGENSEQIPNMSVSYPNFVDWRERNRSFEAIAAHRYRQFNLTGLDRPEVLSAVQASASLFSILGVEPMLGRPYTAEEDRVGGEAVTVVSHAFWQSRLGADAAVVGSTLSLDGDPFLIVGVMPPGFLYPIAPFPVDLWMPIERFAKGWLETRGSHPGIYVTGLVRAGTSMEQSRSDMESIAAALAQEYPDSNTGNGVSFTPLIDRTVRNARPALTVLAGAVALVLLIACVNVANLLLARGSARRQELALRSALGSGRGGLVRQLLTESVVLSLLAGVAAIAVAWAVLKTLLFTMDPSLFLMFGKIELNATVLAFTAALALFAGVFFGAFPALQLLRQDLGVALKEGGRGSSGSQGRLRGALVVAEMALALVLLVGAVLLVQSFDRLVSADAGFDDADVLTLNLLLSDKEYPESAQQLAFFDQLLERVRGLPGVVSASTTMPLLGGWQNVVVAEGQEPPPPGEMVSVDTTRISTDYFRTMGVRLLKGRPFSSQDRQGSLPVAIVDKTFAEAFWPAEDAIGKRVKLSADPADPQEDWLEVVGIANHVKNYGVSQPSRIEIYMPLHQQPNPFSRVVIKTSVDPRSLALAVEQEVLALDSNQPVMQVRTLEEIVARTMATQRLATGLLGLFSLLAVSLAAIGIYGVMAYAVVQRRREIGVRMSLGASSGRVLWMFLVQGLQLVAMGVVAGLVLAFLAAPILESQLFGIDARDLGTFLLMPVALVLVALVASIVPAFRASRVAPARVLHYE